MLTLEFGWQYAIVIFAGFNYVIGVDIMRAAYQSLYEGGASRSGRNVKFELVGYILNYLIQLTIVAIEGWYSASIDEGRAQRARMQLDSGSAAVMHKWGMIFFVASIFLWYKALADTPWLRQFCVDLINKPFRERV